MVEITVKAVDSASAMEEIEKRLGADAMIVSTNRVDGQIEIVATNDDPSKYQKIHEPLVLDKNYRIKRYITVSALIIDRRSSNKTGYGCWSSWSNYPYG